MLTATVETRGFQELIKHIREVERGEGPVSDAVMSLMHGSMQTFEKAVTDETPVNFGTLRASIQYVVQGRLPGQVTGTLATPLAYGLPVEHGRAAGRMPPVDAIEVWVTRKGIAPAGKEARSVAFLIARAIGRRGTEGAHMFEKGYNAALPHVMRAWDALPGRIAGYLAR